MGAARSRRPASRRGRPSPGRQQKRAARRGRFSWLYRGLASGFIGAISAAIFVFWWSFWDGAVSGEVGELTHFEVTSDDKGAVMDALAQAGLLESPGLTKVYATMLTPGIRFEKRSHLITRGISARELVQRLAELGTRPTAKVTLPEGWTHQKMAERLEEAHVCSALGFQGAAFDKELLRRLELSQASAEGYLFPATYEFPVDADPRSVVERLVREAKKRIAKLLDDNPLNEDLRTLALSESDIITLASIVEKETSKTSEAPRVARVFLNRLLHPEAETKGRLQSDPTAAYGCLIDPLSAPSCRTFRGGVVPEMLDDSKNPYNTYRHPGLPPSPIANPGEDSIRAVIAPSEGNELYFVANGKGGHTFSATYAEHRVAVDALRAQKSAK